MFLLASFAIDWRVSCYLAGSFTLCISDILPHVYLVVALVFILAYVCLVDDLMFIQAFVTFLLASAVFGWQAQLPSAGGLNICIIIYSLRMSHRK